MSGIQTTAEWALFEVYIKYVAYVFNAKGQFWVSCIACWAGPVRGIDDLSHYFHNTR